MHRVKRAYSTGLIVIIPTYNSARVIKKTLLSLLCQDDKDFGVLAIDDNSTDRTREIASSFGDKLKLRIINKPKGIIKGAAASINFSKRFCQDRPVALIDSDARLSKNWVRVIKQLLKKEKIVGAPIFAEKSKHFWAYLAGLEIESRYKKLKEGRVKHLSTCNLAIAPGLFREIKLNEGLKYAYDHDLSFQLNKKNILFYLTKETSCTHANKGSLYSFSVQQYRIAKYHTVLSKKMPRQAIFGDEISPSLFALQPPVFLAAILFLFFNAYISLVLFIFLLCILNGYFLLYLIRKKYFLYLLPAIVLVVVRNIAWILGVIAGIVKI